MIVVIKQIPNAILDENGKPHCPKCNSGYENSGQVDYGLAKDKYGNTYFEFVRKCYTCSKDNKEHLYKYLEENLGDKEKVIIDDIEEVKCNIKKDEEI